MTDELTPQQEFGVRRALAHMTLLQLQSWQYSLAALYPASLGLTWAWQNFTDQSRLFALYGIAHTHRMFADL